MDKASGARDQEARDTEPLIPVNTITSECSPPPCMVIPSSTTAEIDMVVGNGGCCSGGDDLEAASAPSCRICLECDCDYDDELISPCMCKGTQQFVHRSCLDHWRSVKEGFAFSHCTTCKAQYHLRVVSFETNSWRSLKFRLFVARDLLLGLLAIQTVISAIGAFAYLMDKDGAFRNSFSDGWDAILSRHPIPFYYCIGVVIFFVVLGFCGLVAQCLLCCGAMPQTDGPGYGSAYVCYAFNPWGDCSCTGCMMESAGGASMEGCLVLAVVFVVILALLGIVYGFIVATMGVQHVWQRHYHILTKRELTKEYIVEDQHGSYTPPKLDSEQEERLRVLKLL